MYSTWLAAHTSTIKIGTGIAQMAARTPTATAMAVSTLDHLSGGRVILGLGVSGPQVVEGWYGQPSNRPLARTREYVEVIRRALRRDEPVELDGELYQIPYRGEGSQGLGKPLRLMTHPLRADLPIVLGAEGPKNVAQTAEIADGWLPLYYSPFRQEVYADQLAHARAGFEIYAPVTFTDRRRRRRRARAREGTARLLRGRDGRAGQELPHQPHGAPRLRARRRTRCRTCSSPGKREEATAGDARRLRRRDLDRGAAGADPRAARRVAIEPGHHPHHRRPARPTSSPRSATSSWPDQALHRGLGRFLPMTPAARLLGRLVGNLRGLDDPGSDR